MTVTDFTEDGIWDAYRLAFIANKQKRGSNGDTAHVAGLMAVYELGRDDHRQELLAQVYGSPTSAVGNAFQQMQNVLNGTEDNSDYE